MERGRVSLEGKWRERGGLRRLILLSIHWKKGKG